MNKRTKHHKDINKPWYNKTREQAWKAGFADGVRAEQQVNAAYSAQAEAREKSFNVERAKVITQLVSNIGQTILEVNKIIEKI